MLLSHLILPQPEMPGPRTHIPHAEGGPVQNQSHVTTDGQSVSMSWCRLQAALEGRIQNNFNPTLVRCIQNNFNPTLVRYITAKFSMLSLGELPADLQ
jgi:hypothetical protein